jgi:hypothetical protein
VGKYKCISGLEDNIKTDLKKNYRRAWRGWFRNIDIFINCSWVVTR